MSDARNDAVIVRLATHDDIDTIAEFSRRIALETEDMELEIDRLRVGITAHLDDPEHRGAYRVAEIDDQVVGQTLVTLEWSDWRVAWWWWVQSVYVAPEARGRGVFKALYGAITEAARKAGNVCGLRLYVEHENEIAQKAYERLGMDRSNYVFFTKEF